MLVTCVEIKCLRRVRAESSRRPPRHRRDACSMAWRCRFLTARPSQPRNDLVKNCRVHPTHWLISTQLVTLCICAGVGVEGEADGARSMRMGQPQKEQRCPASRHGVRGQAAWLGSHVFDSFRRSSSTYSRIRRTDGGADPLRACACGLRRAYTHLQQTSARVMG